MVTTDEHKALLNERANLRKRALDAEQELQEALIGYATLARENVKHRKQRDALEEALRKMLYETVANCPVCDRTQAFLEHEQDCYIGKALAQLDGE